MRFPIARMFIALGIAAGATVAAAQNAYPGKPVRMVVPLAPGGPTDFLARAVAQNMSIALGQPVVVENKPGADGAVALRDVMAAAPDGYTLLFAIGSMVAVPLLSTPPAFDWAGQLAPVGKVGRVSFCLAVNPDVPARTVAELVAYSRANPEKLSYATSTLGELMAAAQFMRATGIRMTRVPYKGGAQAMPDLLAGRIQVMFGPVTLAGPHAKTGALRILATLLPQRSAMLPDVPTIGEAGFPGVGVPTWQAVFVPANTPPAIVSRLNGELTRALSKPDFRAEAERRGVFIEPAAPEEMSRTIALEQSAWTALIADHKLAER